MTETKPLSAMSPDEVAELIEIPVESWAQQCHAISLAIIQAGLVPGARRRSRLVSRRGLAALVDR